jgi:hypothetical protein
VGIPIEDSWQNWERYCFRIGVRCRHCFEAPPDSIDVITMLGQIMTVCRELRIREDRGHDCLAYRVDLGVASHPSGA